MGCGNSSLPLNELSSIAIDIFPVPSVNIIPFCSSQRRSLGLVLPLWDGFLSAFSVVSNSHDRHWILIFLARESNPVRGSLLQSGDHDVWGDRRHIWRTSWWIYPGQNKALAMVRNDKVLAMVRNKLQGILRCLIRQALRIRGSRRHNCLLSSLLVADHSSITVRAQDGRPAITLRPPLW
jgi:hypothetical protein